MRRTRFSAFRFLSRSWGPSWGPSLGRSWAPSFLLLCAAAFGLSGLGCSGDQVPGQRSSDQEGDSASGNEGSQSNTAASGGAGADVSTPVTPVVPIAATTPSPLDPAVPVTPVAPAESGVPDPGAPATPPPASLEPDPGAVPGQDPTEETPDPTTDPQPGDETTPDPTPGEPDPSTPEPTDPEPGEDPEESDPAEPSDSEETPDEQTPDDTEQEPDSPEPTEDPAVAARVEEILAGLTIEQKIAQMTQIQYADVSPDSARANCYGSIFNGGEELPFTNNPETWASALDELQRATIEGCGIPMLYGIDAVHGNAKVIGSTVFPHGIGLGASGDADLVERVGRATGKECRGAGIHLVFAPSVSVARDERWGRTYEGFGETPELNSLLGAASVRGLQGGGDLSDPGSVAATAKHFVGDGGTTNGKNATISEFGEATMRAIHLPPYQAVVAENIAVIMPSYHRWSRDGQSPYLSADPFALTDVLKNELGFRGFCLSDYDAVARIDGSVVGTYSEASVSASVNAGMDMAMVAFDGGVDQWMASLGTTSIPTERIDDAVRRILRIKVLMGLFDNDFAKAYSNPDLRSQIWSTEHQELAREAVQKSLVLLKNDGVLPLDKTQAVKVAGPYADSMGVQAGGWTVSWQGSATYDTSSVVGETILGGMQQVGTSVESSSSVASGDTVVVVVGENPYAEGYGDHGSSGRGSTSVASVYLAEQTGYAELESALAAGAKVVLVIISGRPMVMDPSVVDGCSAIVAAWLPGSRGIGVADVLYGDVNFTGKLPHTWPRDFDQIPVNVNRQSDEPGNDAASVDVLYPYGHGLAY